MDKEDKKKTYKLSILKFMVLDNLEELWRTTIQCHD
jgi:hypothetical protein